MILNNIKSKRGYSGFTIVELLVVIVVIGILASITIVSYAGVTARANTASAQAAANNYIQKAETYNADQSAYPPLMGTLTSATADKIYALSGVTVDATVLSTTNLPTSPSEINYFKCTDAATVGIGVGYWNYGTSAINYVWSGAVAAGTATALGTGCTIKTT